MKKVFIIAEAGVNHNGNMGLAYRLIDEAVNAGVDAVKFQTFIPENMISIFADKANYQKTSTGQDESQLEMIKKLALSFEDHKKLLEYCYKKKIEFMSSPFDLKSVDFLNSLGLETFKIPSGEIINIPYLKKIGSLNKKIIMSTGMANLGEVEFAIDVLINSGTKRDKISILHCTTNYPCHYNEVNLNAMLTLNKAFKLPIGYSDHTLGIEVAVASVALGATIIEKHFTLDKNMDGPDHKASLEPHELKEMVIAIRNIEEALGDGIKKANKSENDIIKVARKSIVAFKDIKKDEILTEGNITIKRPGTGISPMRWEEIIGKKAIKSFKSDELIIV